MWKSFDSPVICKGNFTTEIDYKLQVLYYHWIQILTVNSENRALIVDLADLILEC